MSNRVLRTACALLVGLTACEGFTQNLGSNDSSQSPGAPSSASGSDGVGGDNLGGGSNDDRNGAASGGSASGGSNDDRNSATTGGEASGGVPDSGQLSGGTNNQNGDASATNGASSGSDAGTLEPTRCAWQTVGELSVGGGALKQVMQFATREDQLVAVYARPSAVQYADVAFYRRGGGWGIINSVNPIHPKHGGAVFVVRDDRITWWFGERDVDEPLRATLTLATRTWAVSAPFAGFQATRGGHHVTDTFPAWGHDDKWVVLEGQLDWVPSSQGWGSCWTAASTIVVPVEDIDEQPPTPPPSILGSRGQVIGRNAGSTPFFFGGYSVAQQPSCWYSYDSVDRYDGAFYDPSAGTWSPIPAGGLEEGVAGSTSSGPVYAAGHDQFFVFDYDFNGDGAEVHRFVKGSGAFETVAMPDLLARALWGDSDKGGPSQVAVSALGVFV